MPRRLPSSERIVHQASQLRELYEDDNRTLVEKYGRFIAPYFMVEITKNDDTILFKGQTVFNENYGWYDLNGLLIRRITFEENVEEADSITLNIVNPDLELQETNLFDIGNNVDLFIGYDNHDTFFMARGIIVEVEPVFAAEEMSSINVVCYDISYFMMEEGRAELVPEGSQWWERRRIPVENNVCTMPGGDEVSYRNIDELAARFRNERVRDSRIQTQEPSFYQNTGNFDNLLGEIENNLENSSRNRSRRVSEGDRSLTNTDEEYGQNLSVPSWNRTSTRYDRGASSRSQQDQQQEYRLGWGRQRLRERRRDAGHIWKGKTDSEIVSAIFFSYGIVPYIEATNESRRRNRRRRRVDPCLDILAQNGIVIANNTRANDENSRREMAENVRDSRRAGSIGPANRNVGSGAHGRDVDLRNTTIRQQNYSQNRSSVSGMPDDYFFTDDQDVPEINRLFQEFGTGGETQSIDTRPYQSSASRVDLRVDSTPSRNQSNNSENRMRKVVQKAGTSDWDFITKLGKQHGFITFTFFDYETYKWIGYWGPADNVPQYREYSFYYNYGDDTTIKTVKPNISVRNQATEVDLIYVDPRSGRENRLRMSMDNINEFSDRFRGQFGPNPAREPIGTGPEVVVAVHGQRVRTRANRIFQSIEDAKEWLMSYWLQHADDYFIINGETIIGIPEMRARQYHYIEGIGKYSGRFFVTATTHSIGTGRPYETSFVARADHEWDMSTASDSNMLTVESNNLGERSRDGEDRRVG
jgi:hypothetical protein